MGSRVVTVEASDRLELRRSPLTSWMQFANIATLAVASLLLFKLYKVLHRFWQWITSPSADFSDIQTILFLGPKTEFNQNVLHEISSKFKTPVSRIADEPVRSRRVLLYGDDWAPRSRQDVLVFYEKVSAVYGAVDLLIISEQQQQQPLLHDPNDFLTQLNHRLLAQFWVVMAFLPGMLARNKGQILSIAMDNSSSLANSGIMRTVYEDVAGKDTKVVLTLVERNSFLTNFLPNLPAVVMARLAADAIGRTDIVNIPTLIHYFTILPAILGRMYVKPLLDFLWSPRTRLPRRPTR